MRRARILLATLAMLIPAVPLLGVQATVAHAASCTGPSVGPYPNDPQYAPAERGQAGYTWDAESWYLYGCVTTGTAPLSSDPQGASGMSVSTLWNRAQNPQRGRDDVTVSYVEGGVNWRIPTSCQLKDRAQLNTAELPFPENAGGQTKPSGNRYDLNNDGVVNVEDYVNDPRVIAADLGQPKSPSGGPFLHHVCSKLGPGNTDITPEDLIVAFGHCQITSGVIGPSGCPANGRFDNDHNGYPNDINGWNFNRDNNDPQTEQSVYEHFDAEFGAGDRRGQQQLRQHRALPAVPLRAHQGGRRGHRPAGPRRRGDRVRGRHRHQRARRHLGVAGVEPDRPGRHQLRVQQGHGGGLRQQRLRVGRPHRRDVLRARVAGQLHHRRPLHAQRRDLPGLAVLRFVLSNTTYTSRSSLTSYGPHSLFSVPNTDGSTSTGTPTQAGVAALVVSEGKSAVDRGQISSPLTANEVQQLVRSTAMPINAPCSAAPAEPCFTAPSGSTFNIQYGYGRPNVLATANAVDANHIPPVADIQSPSWYQWIDPTTHPNVTVSANIDAPRVTPDSYSWVLQYGLGPQPNDATGWTTFASGSGGGPATVSGIINTASIPSSFWGGQYTVDPTTRLSIEQYDVSVRVRVFAKHDTTHAYSMGEDRRAFHLRHDATELPGFPLYLGASGEASPTLADIEGTGKLDTIIPTSDGLVHAIRPDGTEAPGFPVHTGPAIGMTPSYAHDYLSDPVSAQNKVPRPADAIVSAVAVGDLNHTGALDIVGSTLNGWTYAWDGAGRLLPHFPVLNGSRPSTGCTCRHPTRRTASSPRTCPSRRRCSPTSRATAGSTSSRRPVTATCTRGGPTARAVPGWPVSTLLPPGTVPPAASRPTTARSSPPRRSPTSTVTASPTWSSASTTPSSASARPRAPASRRSCSPSTAAAPPPAARSRATRPCSPATR